MPDMDGTARRRGRWGRAGVAALVVVALAWPGQAALAQRPGSLVRGGAGSISTLVGGVGGPAKATSVAMGFESSFTGPCGVGYGDGHLYVAAGRAIREVAPSTDWLTTPAGTGTLGPLGDGGPAGRATVDACAVAVDHAGNLVIADTYQAQVRVVAAATGTFYGQAMTAGDIYTVAGDGAGGFAGDGGPAVKAELNYPHGVAVDSAGNLVIADSFNARVRVVAASTGVFYGQSMTAGDIYTIAGDGSSAYAGDGGPATEAGVSPESLTFDPAGNLVIADTFNNRVRIVAEHNGTYFGQKMTAGDIYTVAGDGTSGFAGDGGPATAAELGRPAGVLVTGAGNLLIADQNNDRIRVVTG
jgi:hypothetical protein